MSPSKALASPGAISDPAMSSSRLPGAPQGIQGGGSYSPSTPCAVSEHIKRLQISYAYLGVSMFTNGQQNPFFVFEN